MGATSHIASGAVSVRGLVEPVAYTETGLLLSDNSTLDTDAVIWCTGFADTDVHNTAREVLGTLSSSNPSSCSHSSSLKEEHGNILLGPDDIAARVDATWGVDAEGEVRGVWKRQLRMENYWVTGGGFMH
jgi:hypothetical protein